MDQYRLVQAALAGSEQNGQGSREITRVYVGNMFRRESLINESEVGSKPSEPKR